MADRALPNLKLPSAPKAYDQQDQSQMRRQIEQHWHPGQSGGGGSVEAHATVLLTLDNGATPLVDGMFYTAPVSFDYSIVGYRLIEDSGVSGSVVLSVSYAKDTDFPTFTEISGSQRPTLSSSYAQERTAAAGNFTGWTQTSGVAYSQLRATVVGDAVGLTRCTLAIALERADLPTTGGSGGGSTTTSVVNVWHDGSGVPSSSLGNDGDYYLNDSTGDVYTKSSGAWTVVANIKGATGSTGSAGAAGSVWRDGSGAPSSGLGSNGDYYLDDATGNVYAKAAGSYSIVTTLVGTTGAAGAAGSVWHDGSGAPSSGLGVDGDYYLDDSTGDVYTKSSGSWGSPVGNIAGPAGTNGAAGVAGAINPIGACFDGNGFPLTLSQTVKVAVGPVKSAGTVTKVAVVADQSGTLTFGVKKCARSSYPGSLSDVTGGHDVSLSAAATMEDSTLTGWTTSYSADDVYQVQLKAVDGVVKQATLLLIS